MLQIGAPVPNTREDFFCHKKRFSIKKKSHKIEPENTSDIPSAEAPMGRVTRVLSRAKRRRRGCFCRLTDCHLLEEDGGMACLSSSRKHLPKVPGLTPRVEGDGHFLRYPWSSGDQNKQTKTLILM